MSAPEMRCPSCNGVLKPAVGRVGLLECASCQTLYSSQPSSTSVLDVLSVIFLTLGKIILVLGGLVVLAVGVLFAGCLFSGFHIR